MELAESDWVGAGHFRAIQEALSACAPEPYAYQKPLPRPSHDLAATTTLPVVVQSVPPGMPWLCRARSLVAKSVTAIMLPDTSSKNPQDPRKPSSPTMPVRHCRNRLAVGKSPPARHARMEQ